MLPAPIIEIKIKGQLELSENKAW